jgi:pimeloyl-ACP methyl ester carboxylesterase
MPTVDIDGNATRYEISGSGPPILLMASSGFDSAIETWSTNWPWQHFLPLQTFAREYTCIAYDRREAGQSGGRVEKLIWAAYADQAKGLMDHPGQTSASEPPDHIRDRILDFFATHARAGVHA